MSEALLADKIDSLRSWSCLVKYVEKHFQRQRQTFHSSKFNWIRQKDLYITESQQCCWLLGVSCLGNAVKNGNNQTWKFMPSLLTCTSHYDKVIWYDSYCNSFSYDFENFTTSVHFLYFKLHSLSLSCCFRLLDRFGQRWQRQAGSR